MGSQCSFSGSGVKWLWWGAKRTSLAAKFKVFWRGWMTELGVLGAGIAQWLECQTHD